jgi:hypothetical protein
MRVTLSASEFKLRFSAFLLIGAVGLHVLFGAAVARHSGDQTLIVITVAFCWGIMPYLALLLIVPLLSSRLILFGALILMFGTELLAMHDTIYPRSSTSGLAFAFQPLYAFAMVASALVIDLAVRATRAFRKWRDDRQSDIGN